jgi:hypothetical protein
MNRVETLKALETVLESFLHRAVRLKEGRLRVLDGINRLDDIARGFQQGGDLTQQMGGWFAEHNRWLKDQTLRPAEGNRIRDILGQIKREIRVSADSSPASNKIAAEIDRWNGLVTDRTMTAPADQRPPSRKIVLKRGPETAESPEPDSISKFALTLDRLGKLFKDISGNKGHLMSVLDDSLKSAAVQRNREALILSALIIYSLKQDGYKVEPFVKRLREAEAGLKGVTL